MEDFVSFEIAKKLKEKGFREECLAYYSEDKAYEAWKMMNDKFMKRYIEELIMLDELQFSFKSGYSGHFDMEIHMGDKFLTSVAGDICMKENSLEW